MQTSNVLPEFEGFQNVGSCCGAVVFVDESDILKPLELW